ncbi:hypothetical protein GCM10010954_18300 [Halobacillus andaensis]|uniref:Uncharacterized protein n=1 Tax=Halobacillus andaensis TaxID=1176239 RepID=A0A917EXB3_HALAA|nr:hypothetical protein GCM10010954_18300 [Halobacillus andaensis]
MYRELVLAAAAQDGVFTLFFLRPFCSGMVDHFFVAVVAGIVIIAAVKFNGDNIHFAMVMGTAGLRIELNAFNF